MRALVIDDHPLIQEIVPAVLAKALGQVSVTSEITLEGGIESAAASEPPELVVLDLGLPGCQGLDALWRFRKRFPQIPVVVLSATCERRVIREALAVVGVRGYILKTAKPDVMIAALKLVAAGGRYVPPEALDAAPAPRGWQEREPDLTERQREVLQLMLKGYNNERIAGELAIAHNTVKQHAHAIFTALGVSTRAEAVIAATRLMAARER